MKDLATVFLLPLLLVVMLAIPSFFAGVAFWYAWNFLLGAYVSLALPHVGFFHCWATMFCVGYVTHYLQASSKQVSSNNKEN